MVKALTYGRAGNFFFQCAAAISYALKHGLEFTVNDTTSSEFWNPLYLKHLVNPKWDPNLPSVILTEPHFHYAEIPFDESFRQKNVILSGYWQSPLFFKGYEKQIIELFGYPWSLVPDVCSIHARFGDYLTIAGKHIIVNKEYIEQAIRIIRREKNIHRFKIFSDDLNYFRSNFGNIYNFEYSTNKTIEEDLVEISCCHSNINSSSTFSFWGALLNRNPDKMVITQSKWFGDGWKDEYQREVLTHTIIPDEWIKIDA